MNQNRDRVERYDGWSAVPAGVFTKSQLADLDQPRRPVGEPTARVRGQNYRGKPQDFDLWALGHSEPSPAGVGRLGADQAGRDLARTCVDCDARTDRPCSTRHGRPLCHGCGRIADIIAAQARAVAYRRDAVEWARRVADERTRYVHAAPVWIPGRATPAAAVVTVAGPDGSLLLSLPVRFARSGTAGLPEGAVSRAAAAGPLLDAVGDGRPLHWNRATQRTFEELTGPTSRVGLAAADRYVTAWRGDVDPATLAPRPAVDPGSAERLWHLIARMAATPVAEVPAAEQTRLANERGAVWLRFVTHDQAAALRIESVLRALEMDAGPTVVARGGASRHVPGAYEVTMPVQPDGLPRRH